MPESSRRAFLRNAATGGAAVVLPLERLGKLQAISFRGPGIVELDRVPDPDRTPKQSAELNERYVTETLGLPL